MTIETKPKYTYGKRYITSVSFNLSFADYSIEETRVDPEWPYKITIGGQSTYADLEDLKTFSKVLKKIYKSHNKTKTG